MFQIGAEFEFARLKEKMARRAATWIAIASLVVPFLLGLAIGHFSQPRLASAMDRTIYSLFIGVGMAITALPILDRILVQFDLQRRRLGVVALAVAAVNDVVGWMMLAVVSALAAAELSWSGSALQIGGLIVLMLVARFALAPLAGWLVRRFPVVDGVFSPNLMAIVLCLIFALAIVTLKLGIFANFGGFLGGLLFHRHLDFVTAWRRQVGGFVQVFFSCRSSSPSPG